MSTPVLAVVQRTPVQAPGLPPVQAAAEELFKQLFKLNGLFTVVVALFLFAPEKSVMISPKCEAEAWMVGKALMVQYLSFSMFLLSTLLSLASRLSVQKKRVNDSTLKHLFRITMSSSVCGILFLVTALMLTSQVQLGKLMCGGNSNSLIVVVFLSVATAALFVYFISAWALAKL